MNKFLSYFYFFSSDLISQIDIDWIKLRDVYYKSEYEDVDGCYQTHTLENLLKNSTRKRLELLDLC